MSNVAQETMFSTIALNTRVVGAGITHFQTTPSTNTCALESHRDGAVFVADSQSAGRGRHGRRWHSAPGLGLYFSVALQGPLPGVGFAAALATRNALLAIAPLTIKWPNDLYWNARKIGGILVEQRDSRLALGIGINVNHTDADFPPSLRYRAGSLAQASGCTWDRKVLLQMLLEHLDVWILQLRQGEYENVRTEWIHACGIIGRTIRRGGIRGNVAAVDQDGALLVRTINGLQRITCGDVSVVG